MARKDDIKTLTNAIELLLEAMVMQERRETGEFHLSQPAALHIWLEAKDVAENALAQFRDEIDTKVVSEVQ